VTCVTRGTALARRPPETENDATLSTPPPGGRQSPVPPQRAEHAGGGVHAGPRARAPARPDGQAPRAVGGARRLRGPLRWTRTLPHRPPPARARRKDAPSAGGPLPRRRHPPW